MGDIVRIGSKRGNGEVLCAGLLHVRKFVLGRRIDQGE